MCAPRSLTSTLRLVHDTGRRPTKKVASGPTAQIVGSSGPDRRAPHVGRSRAIDSDQVSAARMRRKRRSETGSAKTRALRIGPSAFVSQDQILSIIPTPNLPTLHWFCAPSRRTANFTTTNGPRMTIIDLAEARRAKRRQVLDMGLIRFGDMSVRCLLRDLSEVGAALDVGPRSGIPDQFTLIVVPKKKIYSCNVMWRMGRRIGVVFRQGVARTE